MRDLKKFAFFIADQLKRRRWTALLAAWTICVIGWLAIAMIPDRYVSVARFHVDTTTLLTPLLKGISVNADEQNRDQVAVMQRTLTSRPNLLRVLQMTDMDKVERSEAATQRLVDSLEERIEIKSQGPNLFQVQFADNSPEMAKNVIQALLTIFVESSIGDKREDIKSAQSFIDNQIAEYEAQLKAAEQKLADFKVENVDYLSSSSQTFAARMETAQTALKAAQFEYEDAVALRDRLRAQLSATPQYLAVDAGPQIMVGGSGVTGGTRAQRIQALRARLDELRSQLTDKHPDVISTQQALTRLMKERDDPNDSPSDVYRSRVPNELYNQLSLRLADAEDRASTAKRKFSEARSDFEMLQARTSEAPQVEAEFTNLNRDYSVMRASYEALLQRRESARIAAAADSTSEPIQFRMIAAPEVPALPSGPPRTLLNTLVLIMGLAGGCGFVILLSQVDNRITSADDLSSYVGSRVLGCVSLTEVLQTTDTEQLRRFGYATLGLILIFALILLIQPNFSALAQFTTKLPL
jgi:polysaccharide chain length determinant protein (PEP-CTERM system associated)